ncbi:MAG TPA: FAD-dependent oxidoreductase [Phycisphaerales bacterium]|nr:FAD-dependent oxidoreductase [Phycisphaerales bacterium]
MSEPRIVIIGTGPTGLGAGYRLKELGYTNFVLYERNPYIGGLSHSFVDSKGFTWDIGGHVMFSHYTYYDQCFEKLMGKEFTLNNRESWVRMFDTWVPYPFQNNVRYLPKQAAFECIAGLVKAQGGKGKVASAAAARNFGEFIDAVFGEGIAKHFMRPYNYKVWAYEPERMNKHWIGERVAVIDVERALKNVILGTDDFGWGPNNQFKFPMKGGTGEFYRRFGPELGMVRGSDGDPLSDREGPHSFIKLNKQVKSIDVDAKVVAFTDGTTDRYDVLISTMPLDVLCGRVIETKRRRDGETEWKDVAAAAGRLLHSSGYMVGIGLKSRTPGGGTPDTKSWMYFPEANCPFYRVTYLSNYSPFMTPDKDNYYSLLCEVSESDAKKTPGQFGKNPGAVIEDCIRGLENAGLLNPGERENIVSRWCYYADYSYPTPSVERDDILSEVIPWLEARGVYSRGRFGMWKYEVANTDHSLMQGVELVNRLLLGEAETTIGMVYKVTEDGRNAASHERPGHAGSGEKRLAASRPIADEGPVIEVKPEPAVKSIHPEHVGDIDAGEISGDELAVGEASKG